MTGAGVWTDVAPCLPALTVPGPRAGQRAVAGVASAVEHDPLVRGVSGGESGSLELVDIAFEQGKGGVFASYDDRFDAVNVRNGQMLAGLRTGSMAAPEGAVLTTFTYRASRDASGAFVIDVLHDEAAGDQTFLVSDFTKKIEVVGTKPAVIHVVNDSTGIRR